jgi:AAA15 family ATPase/GTPase
MTNLRKISVNIAIETLAKNGVLNIQGFMSENKAELIETMKEAEKTERWTLIQDKVKELLEAN